MRSIIRNSAGFLAAVFLISSVYPVKFSAEGYALSAGLAAIFLIGYFFRKNLASGISFFVEKTTLWHAIAAGAILRFALLMADDNFQISDYWDFRQIAFDMLDGQYWANPRRPPGPSWFSAFFYHFFGKGELSALIPNAALSVFQVWLIGAMGSSFFGKKAGVLAAWLAALNPEFIIEANYVTTELGFFLCIYGAIWLAFGQKTVGYLFVAGALLGLAQYFRSTAPVFFAVLVVVLIWANSGMRINLNRLGPLSVGFLLMLSPIIFFNKTELKIWSLNSYQMGGAMRFMATNPDYLGQWNPPDGHFFDSVLAKKTIPTKIHPAVFYDKLGYQLAAERFQAHVLENVAACLFFKPYNFWGDVAGVWCIENLFKNHQNRWLKLPFELWLVFSLKILLICSAFCLKDLRESKWPAGQNLMAFFLIAAVVNTFIFFYFGVSGRFHNVFTGWQCWLAAIAIQSGANAAPSTAPHISQ